MPSDFITMAVRIFRWRAGRHAAVRIGSTLRKSGRRAVIMAVRMAQDRAGLNQRVPHVLPDERTILQEY
jgi:hypothetical protein